MEGQWGIHRIPGPMKHEMNYEEIIHSMTLEGGGLIEIYVLDTDCDDWSRAVEWMRDAGLVDSFTCLDEEFPVKITSDVFEEDGNSSFRMAVVIGGQIWTTGFHSCTEIDFQGDPRRVQSIDDLTQIADFMKALSRVTKKRVVLVSETLDPAQAKPYMIVEAASTT